MIVNVRLDKDLESALVSLARREGLTKSDVLRQCLREFVARKQSSASPWELGKDVFGKFGSGRSDLSSRRKAIVREKIRGKKDRRRLGSPRRAIRQG